MSGSCVWLLEHSLWAGWPHPAREGCQAPGNPKHPGFTYFHLLLRSREGGCNVGLIFQLVNSVNSSLCYDPLMMSQLSQNSVQCNSTQNYQDIPCSLTKYFLQFSVSDFPWSKLLKWSTSWIPNKIAHLERLHLRIVRVTWRSAWMWLFPTGVLRGSFSRGGFNSGLFSTEWDECGEVILLS